MIQTVKWMLGTILKWILPKDKDNGRRYIIRLEDESGLDSWYMEWSTNTHAPLCRGMPKSKFRDWYLNKYKNYDPMRLEARLDTVDAFGSDKPGAKKVDEIVSNNRAGHNNYVLSKEELINMYCSVDDYYDNDVPQIEEYQKVSFFKDRVVFLTALSKEAKRLFPEVVGFIECGGGRFDPENEECAKAILSVVDDDKVSIDVKKDPQTQLWTCNILTAKGSRNITAEGFDNNRNVAFCIAAVNWATQVEARDRNGKN